MMSKSQRGKSCCASWKKRSGNDSPKKTMSGFTRPPWRSAIACQPSGPSLPWATAARTSSTSTASPVSMHEHRSKLPCAATVICAGSEAVASSAVPRQSSKHK